MAGMEKQPVQLRAGSVQIKFLFSEEDVQAAMQLMGKYRDKGEKARPTSQSSIASSAVRFTAFLARKFFHLSNNFAQIRLFGIILSV